MLSAVGTRYAKALIEVVMAPGSKIDPKQALAELRAIQELIDGSTVLHNALLSPAVSPARKRAVMGRLIEPMGVSRPVRNFAFVVIDHRRIHSLASMVEAFDILIDERLGFVRGAVSSASPLTDSQRVSLDAELSRLTGKRTKLNFTIDPALIGGVVARVGSLVYDGSVRGQLERLRVKLANG
jgi:F-type H+-transporting ATPase subunit delta